MDINELTIGQAREVASLVGGNPAAKLHVQLPGLQRLVGERVALFCLNYIYAGTLKKVDGDEAVLTDAGIVYETGAFERNEWEDFQTYGEDIHVAVGMIEAYGRGK